MTVVAPITWAEVQTAFDEIHEKQHLAGIRLHFDRDGGRLRANFEPVEPRPADLQALGRVAAVNPQLTSAHAPMAKPRHVGRVRGNQWRQK
jgi:hypothetical protein